MPCASATASSSSPSGGPSEPSAAAARRKASIGAPGGPSSAPAVSSLERHDYVERVPDPADRRAKLVRATARGGEVYAVARELVADVEARLAARMGRAKVRRLESLLRELATALPLEG